MLIIKSYIKFLENLVFKIKPFKIDFADSHSVKLACNDVTVCEIPEETGKLNIRVGNLSLY